MQKVYSDIAYMLLFFAKYILFDVFVLAMNLVVYAVDI